MPRQISIATQIRPIVALAAAPYASLLNDFSEGDIMIVQILDAELFHTVRLQMQRVVNDRPTTLILVVEGLDVVDPEVGVPHFLNHAANVV